MRKSAEQILSEFLELPLETIKNSIDVSGKFVSYKIYKINNFLWAVGKRPPKRINWKHPDTQFLFWEVIDNSKSAVPIYKFLMPAV